MKKKKNSNRSHHQNHYQFATFARMTDRNAQIKHQSKLLKLIQMVSTSKHDDIATSGYVDVEENNGQTKGE